MFEELKKALDKGMDYAFMTKDKVEKAVKEFAKENNLNKEEAKKLFDQVVKKSEETRNYLEERAVELQKAAIQKMNLVTKEDYMKLEDRIKKLEGFHKTPAKTKKKIAAEKVIVQHRKKG
jgi:polyhydroxyalkanoate synthesis regulator phasin